MTPTTAGAPSPERRSGQCSRPPTSARYPRRGASPRQRSAAPFRRPHHVRPRLSRHRPKHRLLVSPRLRDEFGNGEQFYALAGQPITVPERRADQPNREFLEWHLDRSSRRPEARLIQSGAKWSPWVVPRSQTSFHLNCTPLTNDVILRQRRDLRHSGHDHGPDHPRPPPDASR